MDSAGIRTTASSGKPSEHSKIPLKKKEKMRETEKDYSLLNLKIKRALLASVGKVMSQSTQGRYDTKLGQAKGKFEDKTHLPQKLLIEAPFSWLLKMQR